MARKTVHNCLQCFKANPRSINPLMGNLPAPRVQPSLPFLKAGTDYVGLFFVRERRGRCVKRFICLVTKAVHLEAVTDLTKESFLATLKRFIARRGKPTDLYSDNGTTYVGAHNELNAIKIFLEKHNNALTTTLANEGIIWHFTPPYAPNFGGIWEASVKNVKYHLKRVLCNSSLTFEGFLTVLVGIEGILNSRPLTPMSPNPTDLQPLTPAHFLLGRPVTAIVEPVVESPSNRLTNFQLLQELIQHFWARWSKEYLSQLQQRAK